MTSLHEQQQKATNFSWLAPFYDTLGAIAFNGNLHRSQAHLLAHYPPQLDRVLIIGGGTGKFLIELLKKVTVNKLIYLDVSPGMIRQAQKKVAKIFPQQTSIEFICGSLQDIPELEYDLIITHYFLDCFPEKEFIETSQVLKGKLAIDGYWSMVDFCTTHSASRSKKMVVKALYKFFQLTCRLNCQDLANFDPWFEQNLEVIEQQNFCRGLLKASLYKN